MSSQESEENRENQTGEDASTFVPPKGVGGTTQSQPTDYDEHDPFDYIKNARNPHWWVAYANVFLVPVGIVALVIYGCQLSRMSDAIDLTRETSKLDQRAWVTVAMLNLKKPTIGQALEEWDTHIEVVVSNSGKSPALSVEIFGKVFAADRISEDLLMTKPDESRSRGVMGPQTATTYSFGTHGEVARAITEKKELFISGFIDYIDTFKECHRTSFCALVDPTVPNRINDSGIMTPCEIGNSAN
jgi:hypothetical protein